MMTDENTINGTHRSKIWQLIIYPLSIWTVTVSPEKYVVINCETELSLVNTLLSSVPITVEALLSLFDIVLVMTEISLLPMRTRFPPAH